MHIYETGCNGLKIVESKVLTHKVWLQMYDSQEQLERDMNEEFFQVRTDLSMFQCCDRKGTSKEGVAKTMYSMTHYGSKQT